MKNYLNANNLQSVCEIKQAIPEYGAYIDSLDQADKYNADGATICFPSEEAWESKPEIADKVTTIFKKNGLL